MCRRCLTLNVRGCLNCWWKAVLKEALAHAVPMVGLTVSFLSNGWTILLHVLSQHMRKKVMLIMDGHSSHKSLTAVELAKSNSVVIICLPPDTTHKIQPLDRAAYGPLKVNYNPECDKWMTMHAGRQISQYDQARIVWMCLHQNGFHGKSAVRFQHNTLKSCSAAPPTV